VLANFDLGFQKVLVASLAGIQIGKDLNIEKLTTNLRMATDGLRADNFLAVVTTVEMPDRCGARSTAKNALDFKMIATLQKSEQRAAQEPGGWGGCSSWGNPRQVSGGGGGCSSGAAKGSIQIQGHHVRAKIYSGHRRRGSRPI